MEKFMALLRLSAPWYIYYKELCALFEEDKEVRIVYDTDGQIIDIYVDNQAKADAMTEMLPSVKDFGGIELQINVIPANKTGFRRGKPATFAALFENNPIVNDIFTVDMMTNTMTYIVFRKEVVQYYNDNLGDANGICSTLYQDIASRIFEEKEGVYFCTDIRDINKPNRTVTITPITSAPVASAYTTSTCTCGHL
jgi:hypothetical protein